MIRRAAHDFARARLPVAHLRALRDGKDPIGFCRKRWSELAALGFAGTLVPEALGGAGLGFAELGLVLNELGRTLAPTPLLSTSVLGVSALLLGGSEAQRRAHLPSIAAGERLLALAIDEGARHARRPRATVARPDGDGYRLDGHKELVLDGHAAELLVVAARLDLGDGSPDTMALFLLPSGTPGVSSSRRVLIDHRTVASIRLEGVRVDRSMRLGPPGDGAPLLDALLDRGAIALASEMLGAAEEAFERTVAWLKTRRQFGAPIGSFQALQHRAARLLVALELTRAVVVEALRAVDDDRADVPALAAAAKARATDTFAQVADEAVQMHGGVGVTDELDIGLYWKRSRVAAMTFGDAAFHRDRWATLAGY